MSDSDFKKYECVICGFIYDEAEGLPDDGIAAGTKWEDIPEDWECPDCGISKDDVDLYEGEVCAPVRHWAVVPRPGPRD